MCFAAAIKTPSFRTSVGLHGSDGREHELKFFMFLFCSSWMAMVSFRRVRGLMVFFPFLKCLIAHSATLDWRERSLVENCFASAPISSRYVASATLSYSRNVSCVGSRAPAAQLLRGVS